MPKPQPYTPTLPISTAGRPLPEGVTCGTYALRPVAAGTLEIDIREFVGWWNTEQSNFVRRVKEAAPDLVKLSIASLGGYVADALAIHDFLKSYPARVEVEITGTTASAATIIAMCGDEVRMSDNALFLVHYSRMGLWAWGPADLLEEATDQAVRSLRKHDQVLRGLYRKRTGATDSDLDELLKMEEWLTADEALDWGFIDAVFEPEVEEDAEGASSATAYAPALVMAMGLPRLLRKDHRPVAGENFAAWSNRLIDAINDDEDDERTRADVIGELAEAVSLTRGIIRAILNEEDPIQCPFTNAERFPTPADRRDAVRTWAGVLDASPRDAFAALEADGCTYNDEDEEAEDRAGGRSRFRFDANPNPTRAMSKPNDTPAAQPDQPEAAPEAKPAEQESLATMRAELDQMKAENQRLAQARRESSLNALRQALTGRVPGRAADALVELAEAADKAAGGKALTFEKPIAAAKEKTEASVIDRLAAIAGDISPLVERRMIDTTPSGDGESRDADVAQATVKM